MRRCSQVNVLSGQHIQALCCLANPLEVWQVRMKVESFDLLKKPQGIERPFNDRRWRAVSCSGGPKAVSIFDWRAQTGEQRLAKPPKP